MLTFSVSEILNIMSDLSDLNISLCVINFNVNMFSTVMSDTTAQSIFCTTWVEFYSVICWRTFTNFTFLILNTLKASQIFSTLSESKNLTFGLLSFLSSFIDSSLFSFMFNSLCCVSEITTCEVCYLSDHRVFDVERLCFLWACCFVIFVFCFKISSEHSCDCLLWLFCDAVVRSELSALRTWYLNVENRSFSSRSLSELHCNSIKFTSWWSAWVLFCLFFFFNNNCMKFNCCIEKFSDIRVLSLLCEPQAIHNLLFRCTFSVSINFRRCEHILWIWPHSVQNQQTLQSLFCSEVLLHVSCWFVCISVTLHS